LQDLRGSEGPLFHGDACMQEFFRNLGDARMQEFFYNL
jgi:hypothetical protein